MHQPSKVTAVGKTAHFEVSYLTTLGKKGDTLARAILHNCERDYAALKKFFGGLTPKHLPFVVQVTSGSGGASHSTCMGTDLLVAAYS